MCKDYHPLSVDTPLDADAAFTRRRFLQSSLALMSTVGTVPGFLASAGEAMAQGAPLGSRAGEPDERVLVVVQLSGGNDGLNTVIPAGMREYYRARPGIGIREQDVLPLDTRAGIGLSPALRDLHEMIGQRNASVIQGVGYPNPNRSHFASMDIWHTADPDAGGRGGRGVGWIGKALDADAAASETDGNMSCISIGSEAPLATQGAQVRPVSFERAELFRWAGRELHPALSEAYDKLHESQPPAEEGDAASFVYRTACDAQVASARVRKAVSARPKTNFPGNPLGNQLRMVASMIAADLPTRVYYVALGGFDTHAGQSWRHAQLLEQFATSMKAFYRELEATGDAKRVVSVAFSEFGRRVAQNASGGTDHGAAGPMFLFGPAVRPGLLGQHPSLDKLDRGDLVYTLDFRQVYSELLRDWLKIDVDLVPGKRLKHPGVLRRA